MMEVDAVIFPRMDEEFVTDLNLSDSEDEGDPNNVMEMTEKESNYGSVTGDINLGRQHHDAPEETGLTKEKKMDILRKLMKEVNLEDTLEKYRGFKESHVQGNNRRCREVSSSFKVVLIMKQYFQYYTVILCICKELR